MATRNRDSTVAASASLMQLTTAFGASRAIYVAAELGIPDLLANGAKGSEELATATKTHPSSLRQLLRVLTTVGIFEEREEDLFTLAPMGELLRDMPGSMRAAALFLAGDTGWRVWGDLLYSVRTGEAAFEHVMGMQAFDYFEAHPEESAVHDQAMEAFSVPVAASVIAAYDSTEFGTIVDVGGGTGLLLAEILAAHPNAHGILFDMPHVVASRSRGDRAERSPRPM